MIRRSCVASRAGGDEVVIDDLGYKITAAQLRTAQGTSWLNDQVINYFCRLVQEAVHSTCTLGSFFASKLISQGYAAASRWTKKVDIFAYQRVLVVINRHSHWTLAVINNAARRFEYYDSLGGGGEDVLEHLVEYAEKEYKAKKSPAPTVEFNFRAWEWYCPKSKCPQQRNAYDCGMFTCLFALHVALETPMSFSQGDIAHARNVLQLELLCGKLLRPPV